MSKLITLLAGAALALAITAPARGGGLTVLPVSIELAPGQTAAVLRVINQDDGPTEFQVRGFAWTQPGPAAPISCSPPAP